ncbi:hypothetical protein JAAARDRAFT_122346, partial [Jaapia argillacea MUCL 33604]
RDEMENLIQQMGAMSLDDLAYGVLYYQALKLDPDIKKVIRAPWITNTNQTYNRTNLPRAGNTMGGPRGPGLCGMTQRCFGCNETRHMMNGCPKLNELLMKGVITKDEVGRIIMMDGTRIR